MEAMGDVTTWLERLTGGDPEALDEVVRRLYDELRQLARSRLRNERDPRTLGTTALVSEAYLRLVGQQSMSAESRTRFFAIASNTMRRVLVDHARTRKRLKRGGGVRPVPLDDVEEVLSEGESDEVLALDDALNRLARANPRAATVVEQRFFAGLSVAEVAAGLGISEKTAQRDWITARAWLRKEVRLRLECG